MGATVTLAGSGTDPDAGDTLAYAWTQPGADSVTLSGASTATATFDAPDGLTEDTTLVFALTVTDAGGLSHQDQVSVTVEGPAPAAVELLTAGVESLPQRHDGSTSFTFELVFSEEVAIGYRTVRDSVFEVTGGEVTRARRHSPPSNMRWVITVVPSSDGDVALVLPSGRSCDSNGAVCTSDGRMLSNRLEPTIEGPAPAAVELLTAGVESLPQRHDGSTSFTFELVFSEEVAIGYRTVRDSVFEVTGGEVTRARRHSPPSNMRWVITVVPSSDGDVVLVLPSGRSCDSNGAVCTSDGRMLSNRLEPTIEGPAPAASPVVSSESAFSVVEGSTAVGVLSAVDADTDVADLVWSMAGGVDASEFSLSASRVLAFLAAKDFEDPDDADGDGTYELTVRVSDGQRAATGDVEVSLANRNEAPTADAGADHTGVAMGATVTLAGSGTDPDAGDTLAYAWTQPGADSVTLSGASTATATFDAPDGLTEDTTLVFALTVTDAGGLSHQDQVSVTVEGPAPADESVEDLAPAVEWGERLMDRDIVLGVSSIPEWTVVERHRHVDSHQLAARRGERLFASRRLTTAPRRQPCAYGRRTSTAGCGPTGSPMEPECPQRTSTAP